MSTEDSAPPRPRTDYELQQIEVLVRRIGKWNDAHSSFDMNHLSETTAAVIASILHVSEVAGAKDILSKVFEKIKRLDERMDRMEDQKDG